MSDGEQPVEITDLEASILRMVRGGSDPWLYCQTAGAKTRTVSQALARLQRKLLVQWHVDGNTRYTATPLGREALEHYDDTKGEHYP